MLHLNTISVDDTIVKRPQPNMLNEKEFRRETERWMNAARKAATAVPSVDFLGWQGEHYVVVRRDTSDALHSTSANRRSHGAADTDLELKELPPRRRLDTGFGVDLGGQDGCWLERIDVPIDYELVGGGDT